MFIIVCLNDATNLETVLGYHSFALLVDDSDVVNRMSVLGYCLPPAVVACVIQVSWSTNLDVEVSYVPSVCGA